MQYFFRKSFAINAFLLIIKTAILGFLFPLKPNYEASGGETYFCYLSILQFFILFLLLIYYIKIKDTYKWQALLVLFLILPFLDVFLYVIDFLHVN